MFQTSVLTISNLTVHQTGTSNALFENANMTFSQGWTAILGDNGIGKTTLVRVIMGELQPFSGNIAPAPKNLVFGYCPQDNGVRPSNIEEFATDWSPLAIGIREQLGIDESWLWRFQTLSGGEQKRVQLACSMVLEPDVLIFDEPSNHVDEDTAQAIASAMQGYQGIGLLISHDVALIDATVQQCLFMERKHVQGRNVTVLTMRKGNYTQSAAQVELEEDSAAQELKQARRTADRIDAAKAHRVYEAAQSAAKRRGDKIDRKDHDAIAKRRFAIVTGKDARAGAASARIDHQVKSAHERVQGLVTSSKRYDGDIWLDARASHRKELVRLDEGLLPYAPESDNTSAALSRGLHIPTLSVGPHDHIGISGPNGTGKTTLFKAIQAAITRQTDSIPALSIDQITGAGQAEQAFESLRNMSSQDRASVFSSMAQLNADPDKLLSGESPSPGELRKLLLCLGARKHPELILMDEPTNHLDLHSKQALGKTLAAFPGAVIIISHDIYFLNLVAEIRWHLHRTEDGAELDLR
ncbi:MAG: ATP-binding cassette domain-containing protein [Bifidobacterium crudilactis]|uniref:ATP-binding cassette domain-containing protein n=1 Tax=Bifidobacterium crudilactis TaxID=327277 RepID=UPI002647E99D|nr:ATP-binding cassette domain-containing protein [Bifidobacterium crudilactis]MDN6586835.1 ATP-binding cassette domain-containing protein [Bifidobacterium crudilactis]